MAGLLRTIIEKRAILLCGAGVAKATSQHKYADWNGLIENGIYTCKDHSFGALKDDWVTGKLRDIREGDVIDKISVASQITARMRKTGTDTFNIWVRNIFSKLLVVDPALNQALGALGLAILTTNYDTLIEQVLKRDIATWKNPELCAKVLKSKSDAILHLHGCWKDPQSLVFDFNSYGQIVANDFIQTLLRCIEFNHSVIFVGMGEGLNDPNFHGFLSWAKDSFINSQTEHYLLVREGEVPTGLPDSIRIVVYGKTHADLPLFLEQLRKDAASSSGGGKPPVSITLNDHAMPSPVMTIAQPVVLREVQTEEAQTIIEDPSGNKASKILRDTARPNLGEMQDIIVLCVLQKMDKELLTPYWKEQLTDKLIYLGQDGDFFTNGVLNKEVWRSYRQYCRNHPDLTHGVVSKFEKIIETHLSGLYFRSPMYYEWCNYYLNIRSWKIGSAVLPELLKGWLMGWLAGKDFGAVIELASELSGANGDEEEIRAFLLDKARVNPAPPKLEYEDLQLLERQSLNTWAPIEKGYLYITIAYNYAMNEEYSVALYYFDLAFPLLNGDPPQVAIFGKAYLDAVATVFIPPIKESQINNCVQWLRTFKLTGSRGYKIARTFYMAGNYSMAVSLWEDRLVKSPGDVTTRSFLIKTLSLHLGKHTEAITVFNNAPETVKQRGFLCLEVAPAYLALEQYIQVESLYKQALSCNHVNRLVVHILLGRLYFTALNDLGAARTHFTAALKETGARSEILEANRWYLSLLIEEGKIEEAISFASGIEDVIDNTCEWAGVDCLNSIARDLYRLNYKLDLAESLIHTAIELKGTSVNTYQMLTPILVRRGNCAAASRYLSFWLAFSNDNTIELNWNHYSKMFQDLISQNEQDLAEVWFQYKTSLIWLMIRWAIRKSSGKAQTIVLAPAQLIIAERVYLQLTGKEAPDKFPS